MHIPDYDRGEGKDPNKTTAKLWTSYILFTLDGLGNRRFFFVTRNLPSN
jgi:hypothetical protein